MGTLKHYKSEHGNYDIVERWTPRTRRIDTRQVVPAGDVKISVQDDGGLVAVLELPNGNAIECNIEMNTWFHDKNGDYIYEGDIVVYDRSHYYVTLAGASGKWNLQHISERRKGYALCDVHDKCRVLRNIDDRTFEERCSEWAEKEGE